MPRKINKKLIKKLKEGSLKPLLTYLQKEQDYLKLEVRKGGKFIVYYKKCKVLEVGLNSYSIDEKYFVDSKAPQNIAQIIETEPKSYFDNVCEVVDRWLEKNQKNEFETQQKIAHHNQRRDDNYIILDMEYQFSQKNIKKEERLKSATYDLLGIDTKTNKVIFFEVKRGLGSLEGKSGIAGHIRDFEEQLNGEHKELFIGDLLTNIKNIIKDKRTLGLLDYTLPIDFSIKEVGLIFIFEPENTTDIEKYNLIFERENTSIHKSNYRTIFVSKEDYKLR